MQERHFLRELRRGRRNGVVALAIAGGAPSGDLALASDITTRCGVTGRVVRPYVRSAQNDAANGATAPGVYGARLEYEDTDGNWIGAPRWIDPAAIEVSGAVAMRLYYLDANGPDIDMGVIPAVPIHLRIGRRSRNYLDPWAVEACSDGPYQGPTLAPDTAVMLGGQMQNGQDLTWKGTPVRDAGGNPLAPLGATHVTGPSRPTFR